MKAAKSKTQTSAHARQILSHGWTRLATPSLPSELVQRCYADWANFFGKEDKEKFAAEEGKLDGYFPFNSEKAVGYDVPDPKEFFHWYRDGQRPESCAESTTKLFESCAQVAANLLLELSAELPELEPIAREVATSNRLVLRIAHYWGEDVEYFNAPHEDIDLLTVLPSATAPGLEVLENDIWKSAIAPPGQCIILTGDMLDEATGGRIKPVRHRVVAAVRERLSMSFFTNPADEVKLSPRWNAGDLLLHRLREIGLAA